MSPPCLGAAPTFSGPEGTARSRNKSRHPPVCGGFTPDAVSPVRGGLLLHQGPPSALKQPLALRVGAAFQRLFIPVPGPRCCDASSVVTLIKVMPPLPSTILGQGLGDRPSPRSLCLGGRQYVSRNTLIACCAHGKGRAGEELASLPLPLGHGKAFLEVPRLLGLLATVCKERWAQECPLLPWD